MVTSGCKSGLLANSPKAQQTGCKLGSSVNIVVMLESRMEMLDCRSGLSASIVGNSANIVERLGNIEAR